MNSAAGKNVLIRADASLSIGSGHVMRCLTLADALRKNGFKVSFICRDLPGNLIEQIKNSNFNVETLPAPETITGDQSADNDNWLGVSHLQDGEETKSILERQKFECLIIDHYGIDRRWERLVRPFVDHIVVIDDLADRYHDCDMLLDQTYGRSIEEYTALVPQNCEIYTGPEYALLRDDFAQNRSVALARREKLQKIKNILITFGGMDQDNMSLTTLEACEQFYPVYKIDIDLVIGSANPHADILRNFADRAKQNIRIHVNSDKMADLMVAADLCIGAGGTTSWERCTLGLPSILVCLAENQRSLIDALSQKGAIISAGDHNHFSIDKLVQSMKELIGDPATLRHMAHIASNICDGTGTHRFTEALCQKLSI